MAAARPIAIYDGFIEVHKWSLANRIRRRTSNAG